MKKAELEAAYLELQEQFSKFKRDAAQEKADMEKKHHAEMSKKFSEVERLAYESWKQTNAKYMKRFIADMIRSGELSFSFESDYAGYFTMDVSMGKQTLTSVSGHICTHRNGYEE